MYFKESGYKLDKIFSKVCYNDVTVIYVEYLEGKLSKFSMFVLEKLWLR